ncbi:hypothetical protein PR048_028031 [Dryococelus australis]|uniref:Uncharacterized protein n=1 Tax=Dryococelus australis TaxID=614101 RepID=A0ABQ9GI83_9NEOP|nr:hypothetical protein PR048_028031 [Dryococelus australis]
MNKVMRLAAMLILHKEEEYKTQPVCRDLYSAARFALLPAQYLGVASRRVDSRVRCGHPRCVRPESFLRHHEDALIPWGETLEEQLRRVYCDCSYSVSPEEGTEYFSWPRSVRWRIQGQEARERYGRHEHARLVPHRSYAQGVQCFRRGPVLCISDLRLWDFITCNERPQIKLRCREMREVIKGYSATHIKCAIAAKRNVLNWRAVFSSHWAYLWAFILLAESTTTQRHFAKLPANADQGFFKKDVLKHVTTNTVCDLKSLDTIAVGFKSDYLFTNRVPLLQSPTNDAPGHPEDILLGSYIERVSPPNVLRTTNLTCFMGRGVVVLVQERACSILSPKLGRSSVRAVPNIVRGKVLHDACVFENVLFCSFAANSGITLPKFSLLRCLTAESAFCYKWLQTTPPVVPALIMMRMWQPSFAKNQSPSAGADCQLLWVRCTDGLHNNFLPASPQSDFPHYSVTTETLHALRIGAMWRYNCVLVSPVSLPCFLTLDAQNTPAYCSAAQSSTHSSLTCFLAGLSLAHCPGHHVPCTAAVGCRRENRFINDNHKHTQYSKIFIGLKKYSLACFCLVCSVCHLKKTRGSVTVIEVSMERRRNERAGKRDIPEKTRRPMASSGTIPTCEDPGKCLECALSQATAYSDVQHTKWRGCLTAVVPHWLMRTGSSVCPAYSLWVESQGYYSDYIYYDSMFSTPVGQFPFVIGFRVPTNTNSQISRKKFLRVLDFNTLRAYQRFSFYVGNVPDSAAGHLVISGISRFSRSCNPALLHQCLVTLISSQDLDDAESSSDSFRANKIGVQVFDVWLNFLAKEGREGTLERWRLEETATLCRSLQSQITHIGVTSESCFGAKKVSETNTEDLPDDEDD